MLICFLRSQSRLSQFQRAEYVLRTGNVLYLQRGTNTRPLRRNGCYNTSLSYSTKNSIESATSGSSNETLKDFGPFLSTKTDEARKTARRKTNNTDQVTTPQPLNANLQEQWRFEQLVNKERDDEAAMRIESPFEQDQPPENERQNPESWVRLLDQFLHPELRKEPPSTNRETEKINTNHMTLLDMLRRARLKSNANVDLLAYMTLRHERHNAVLHLVDLLLVNANAQYSKTDGRDSTSNISWPDVPLKDACELPFKVYIQPKAIRRLRSVTQDQQDITFRMKDVDDPMREVWPLLGTLIIEAANLDNDKSQYIMRTVYLILGYIHQYGLIPETTYTYSPSPFSATVNRPPMLHLLSSRILTTLSDAVWRLYQDNRISRAISSGARMQDVAYDPPGGRFRLKVRELGPEIWLEFVLWCCVEGEWASSGARIIESLQKQQGTPWTAIDWTSGSDPRSPMTNIDWAQVEHRQGGTVGAREAYSAGKPFVEMPLRSISAEVILATLEGLANSVNVGVLDKGTPVGETQRMIKGVIQFLKSQGLNPGYLDYYAVRLLQTNAFDLKRAPDALKSWSQTMLEFRDFEKSQTSSVSDMSLGFRNVLGHTEVQAGIMHQVLEGYIQTGDVQQAVEQFASIQQFVDSSKLRAIQAFLQSTQDFSGGFFSARSVAHQLEYVKSHGQIPSSILGAFLDFVTDANLLRLAEWLIYAEDVDGPMISESMYRESTMATALVKYAAATQDETLLTRVTYSIQIWGRLRSVNLLRALANAYVRLGKFPDAEEALNDLRVSLEGGAGLINVADLIATILKLETKQIPMTGREATGRVKQAITILRRTIQEDFADARGEYIIHQLRLFRQRLGYMMLIVRNLTMSQLSEIGEDYTYKLPPGNSARLPTQIFNVILKAVVETQGAKEGKRLWDLFCRDPRIPLTNEQIPSLSDFVIPQEVVSSHHNIETVFVLRSKDQLPSPLVGLIPAVTSPYLRDISKTDETVEPHGLHDNVQLIDDIGTKLPLPPTSNITFDSQLLTPESTNAPASKPHSSLVLEPQQPIVIPDLRTLRIIVRAAMAERSNRSNKKSPADSLDDCDIILKWSLQFYHAFGAPRQVIENEVQQPLPRDYDYTRTQLNPFCGLSKHTLDYPRISQYFKPPREFTSLVE